MGIRYGYSWRAPSGDRDVELREASLNGHGGASAWSQVDPDVVVGNGDYPDVVEEVAPEPARVAGL
ncbi:MAG: hypothetical protein ACYDED_03555 [Ferrimicrobium sp.]